MRAVWMRARADLRRSIGGAIALMIVLGLFAGAVGAAIAAGRRTATAHPRFLEAADSFDAWLGDFSFFAPDIFWKPDFEWIASLPYVSRTAYSAYFVGEEEADVDAYVDPRFGRDYAKLRLLEGRFPDPDAPEEVLLPFSSQVHGKAGAGDEVTLNLFAGEQPRPVKLTVVGIVAGPGQFPPHDLVGDGIIATPAFVERYESELMNVRGQFVWLRNGEADLPRFRRDLEARTGGRTYSVLDIPAYARNVERSFDLEAMAMWLLGGFLALTIVLIFVPALIRHVTAGAPENGALRALGMHKGQIAVASAIRGAVVLVGGAAIAIPVMLAVSGRFPRGLARIAEPTPGLAFDSVAYAIGIGSIIGLSALLLVGPLVRSAARAEREEGFGRGRTSRLAALFARSGMSPVAVSGARMALEPGSGRSAVPVRSTLAAATLAIAAIVTSFTFGASLQHTLDEPRVYGRGWDVSYGFYEQSGVADNLSTARADPDVAAVAAGTTGIQFEVDGFSTYGMLIEGDDFEVLTDLVAGSFPAEGEVLLGARTRSAIGKDVGDLVSIGLPGTKKIPLRISGIAVVPPMSETMQLGEGLVIRYANAGKLLGEVPPPDELFVRFRSGIDRAATTERVRGKLTGTSADFSTTSPRDLLNLGRIDRLPVILAGLLGALAVAIVGHMLVSAVSRRRRDLAVLKTVGFVRGQVSRAVAWQASILMALALLVGVPAGLVAGRSLWGLLATGLGIHVEPKMDVAVTALVIPVAFVLGNLVAAWPARTAARTHPATVFRSE